MSGQSGHESSIGYLFRNLVDVRWKNLYLYVSYEVGHCIVMDSHEFTCEPDLGGNNKRFNFTDVLQVKY